MDENASTLPPAADIDETLEAAEQSTRGQSMDETPLNREKQSSSRGAADEVKSEVFALTPSMMAEPTENGKPPQRMPPLPKTKKTQLGMPVPVIPSAPSNEALLDPDTIDLELEMDPDSISSREQATTNDAAAAEGNISLQETIGMLHLPPDEMITDVSSGESVVEAVEDTSAGAVEGGTPLSETVAMQPPQAKSADRAVSGPMSETVVGDQTPKMALAATAVMDAMDAPEVSVSEVPQKRNSKTLLLVVLSVVLVGGLITAGLFLYPVVASKLFQVTDEAASQKSSPKVDDKADDKTDGKASAGAADVVPPKSDEKASASVSGVVSPEAVEPQPQPAAPATPPSSTGAVSPMPESSPLAPREASAIPVVSNAVESRSGEIAGENVVQIKLYGVPAGARILVNGKSSEKQFSVPQSKEAVKIEVRHPDYAKTVKRVVPGMDKAIRIKMKKN